MDLHTDISSEDVPFVVEFLIGNKSKNSMKIQKFSLTNKPTFVENLNITEYSNVKVNFFSKKHLPIEAKLYMDCFDNIDYEFKNKTESINNGDKEFIEIGESIFIHRHLNNEVGKALIPGVYKLCVEYNGEFYYSQILIKPKNLEGFEHKKLIEEIEKNINGLSRDWSHINKAIHQTIDIHKINKTNLDICLKLVKDKSQLELAIQTILKNPKLTIRKEYVETTNYNNNSFDNRSVKLNQIKNNNLLFKRFDPTSKIVTLQLEETWENKVNGFLLQVINQILNVIRLGNDDLYIIVSQLNNQISTLRRYNRFEKNKGSESKVLNIKQSIRDLNSIQTEIKLIEFSLLKFKYKISKTTDKKYKYFKASKQFIKTPGYNFFYKYYLIINSDNIINLGTSNEYNWKPTELLYEYWTYIQLINYLEDIGFDIVNNPLSKLKNNNKVNVDIPDGTKVTMILGTYELELIFNMGICKKRNEAISNNEEYWIRVNRNKPDIRLNVYENNIFKKLIVFDAKYTNTHSFWKKKYIYGSGNKVIEQLKLYANSIYKVNKRNENVVEMVIALCPTYLDEDIIFDSETDQLLAVATLKPGVYNEEFLVKLKQYIHC